MRWHNDLAHHYPRRCSGTRQRRRGLGGLVLVEVSEDFVMPDIWLRLMIYIGSIGLLTGVWYGVEWVRSMIAYRRGDLSAFAWVAYSPFIVPLMNFWVSLVLVPMVIIFELLVWLEVFR